MKLSDYLARTDTTVAAFAEAVGVAPTSVYRWLNGHRTPDIQQMRGIFTATRGLVTPNDWVLQ